MNDKIYIYDHNAGEEIIREMTDEEQAQHNAEAVRLSAAKAERLATEAELRATKISAYHKLGLTADEIEALLPNPDLAKLPK
jgi:hypothetical protein